MPENRSNEPAFTYSGPRQCLVNEAIVFSGKYDPRQIKQICLDVDGYELGRVEQFSPATQEWKIAYNGFSVAGNYRKLRLRGFNSSNTLVASLEVSLLVAPLNYLGPMQCSVKEPIVLRGKYDSSQITQVAVEIDNRYRLEGAVHLFPKTKEWALEYGFGLTTAGRRELSLKGFNATGTQVAALKVPIEVKDSALTSNSGIALSAGQPPAGTYPTITYTEPQACLANQPLRFSGFYSSSQVETSQIATISVAVNGENLTATMNKFDQSWVIDCPKGLSKLGSNQLRFRGLDSAETEICSLDVPILVSALSYNRHSAGETEFLRNLIFEMLIRKSLQPLSTKFK